MEKRFENIEDVIAKFLAGETNDNDVALLEEWRKLSSSNEKEFSRYKKIFETGAELKNIIPVSTDAAWLKLKEQISSAGEKGKVIPIKSVSRRNIVIRIAASILIVAGLGMLAFFLTLDPKEQFTEINSNDSVKKSKLPDGSIITLNKNSSIAYSADHFSGKRIVKLKGEAFFDVKHDEANPFVVDASGLKIEDVGTSFNVKEDSSSGVVVISVISGEVKVTTINEQSVNLKAGEEVAYNTSTKVIGKTEKVEENISAYADRIFVFENAELASVLKVLNDVYGDQLGVENPSLNTCRITVTFDNEPLDDIVTVIAETLGLQLQKENDKIIFKGNGCK